MGKREEAITGKIKVLKKNKEAISQEDLHGKYANAYRRLQDSIKDEIRGFILEELAGIKADPGSATIIFQALEKAYVEGGYSKRIGQAAFRDMNAAKTLQIAAEARRAFMDSLRLLEDEAPGTLAFKGKDGAA